MELVQSPLDACAPGLTPVRIPVERLTLAKRRWRGVADDGREFGFDLESPLSDGASVFATDTVLYVIAQRFEPVLEIALDADARAAVRLGWTVGNLHFPLEVAGAIVRVADDLALRQLLEREHIPFVASKRVFHPLSGGHRH